METLQIAPTPDVGFAFEGGFLAGFLSTDHQAFALIVAPKQLGEHAPAIWIPKYKDVPGAKSYLDGRENTQAMAEAGSKLAKWALGLDINGYTDWYLPSQDELEVCYRNLKPTAHENSCWARSGINLSALPPSRPYTPEFPSQTAATNFQQGAPEAFDPDWYWTSTQHAATSHYAWCQGFTYGYQDTINKRNKLRARAVRRFPI